MLKYVRSGTRMVNGESILVDLFVLGDLELTWSGGRGQIIKTEQYDVLVGYVEFVISVDIVTYEPARFQTPFASRASRFQRDNFRVISDHLGTFDSLFEPVAVQHSEVDSIRIVVTSVLTDPTDRAITMAKNHVRYTVPNLIECANVKAGI